VLLLVLHEPSFDTVFALGLRDRQERIKKGEWTQSFLVRFFIGSKAPLTGATDAGFVPVRGDTMTTAQTRRRRPHPARRARKIAGSISVAGLLVLTGCMAATKTSTPSAAATSITTPTTATTTTTAESDDSGSTSRSSTAAAVAATASAQTNTSTHAS